MSNFKFNNKYIFAFIAFLILTYTYVFYISLRGWGYPGHDGNYRHRSGFYWSSVDYYPNQSVRNGGSVTGGGPHGGK